MRSHSRAISLMKEMRVARKALLAYLTISALVTSVTRCGASMPACMPLTTATARSSPPERKSKDEFIES